MESKKLDLRSHDLVEDKRQELLRLFPEIRIEDGKVDFERLKLALGEAVDVGKERYGMNWPGKACSAPLLSSDRELSAVAGVMLLFDLTRCPIAEC